jgi:hypothetical protein
MEKINKRIIHEWRNWLLEYVGDDNYQLSQKDTLSVHTITAKSSMDAENQCQQIITNAKQEVGGSQTNQNGEKNGGDNQT